MPSIFTLDGVEEKGSSRKLKVGECKCVHNPRTGKSTELCRVEKSAKSKTGYQFRASTRCKR